MEIFAEHIHTGEAIAIFVAVGIVAVAIVYLATFIAYQEHRFIALVLFMFALFLVVAGYFAGTSELKTATYIVFFKNEKIPLVDLYRDGYTVKEELIAGEVYKIEGPINKGWRYNE